MIDQDTWMPKSYRDRMIEEFKCMNTFLSIGSGPGIGFATAERFARAGFQIVLSARNGHKAQGLADQLSANGYRAEARTVDAGDLAAVGTLVAEVQNEFGSIDVLHFNAAILRKATLVDQPRDTINTDLAVNIGGAMAAVQAAAPRMFERGCGTVLLTGGAFGLHPHPDFLSLSIGKAGIRALALGIFETFKENGVHVATRTRRLYSRH